MRDPYVHAEKTSLPGFGHQAIRALITDALGVTPDLPKTAGTGCGLRRRSRRPAPSPRRSPACHAGSGCGASACSGRMPRPARSSWPGGARPGSPTADDLRAEERAYRAAGCQVRGDPVTGPQTYNEATGHPVSDFVATRRTGRRATHGPLHRDAKARGVSANPRSTRGLPAADHLRAPGVARATARAGRHYRHPVRLPPRRPDVLDLAAGPRRHRRPTSARRGGGLPGVTREEQHPRQTTPTAPSAWATRPRRGVQAEASRPDLRGRGTAPDATGLGRRPYASHPGARPVAADGSSPSALAYERRT